MDKFLRSTHFAMDKFIFHLFTISELLCLLQIRIVYAQQANKAPVA